MSRSIYDRTLALAQSKFAESWLATIAFIESSFFPVPADVVYFPMALANPKRAYRYALTATVASTLGGIAGYFLGHYAYELIAVPLLELYGRLDEFETLRRCTGRETTMLLLLTSGLAHLPPIKIVTILSGVVDVGIVFFVASCMVARGARFFALAYALRRWGAPINSFIEGRPWVVAGIVAAIVITIYLAFRFLLGSSNLMACP
jgi:membrane protein YqaA with SNARE-associated domain